MFAKRKLRFFLLWIGGIILIGQVAYLLLPYVYVKPGQFQSEEVGALSTFMQNFTYFLIALPIPAICLWGAHNLGDIKNISDEFIEKMLKAVSIFVVLALLIELFRFLKQIAPYFPKVQIPSLIDVAFYFNWFAYSFGELAVLMFGIYQTKLKRQNSTLAEEASA